MAKPRKEGLSHTTIRIRWEDKNKLRSLARNNKEPDWLVFQRYISGIQEEPRDVEIGVAIEQPSGS